MAAPKLLTAEEYFAYDDASETKNELVDGRIWNMAGGTPRHARVSARVARAIGNRLVGSGCDVYSSDLRVALTHQTFAYPDVTVVCGELETWPTDDNTVTNPILIVEVLSPETERYDRGLKLRLYAQNESVRAIVLVTPDMPLIEVYEFDGIDWRWRTYEGLEAVLRLALPELTVPLDEIYDSV